MSALKEERAIIKENKALKKQIEHLELNIAFLRSDILERTANFMTQVQIFEGLMQAALDSAASIGEAKRWYREWAKDINSIPLDALDHNAQIKAIIDKHGFDITLDDHHKVVMDMWQKDRENSNTGKRT